MRIYLIEVELIHIYIHRRGRTIHIIANKIHLISWLHRFLKFIQRLMNMSKEELKNT